MRVNRSRHVVNAQLSDTDPWSLRMARAGAGQRTITHDAQSGMCPGDKPRRQADRVRPSPRAPSRRRPEGFGDRQSRDQTQAEQIGPAAVAIVDEVSQFNALHRLRFIQGSPLRRRPSERGPRPRGRRPELQHGQVHPRRCAGADAEPTPTVPAIPLNQYSFRDDHS